MQAPDPTADEPAASVLLVAGMHRSGTSAVGALLHAAGVDLGREDHLLGASAENERGYFENRRIVRLNDDLLAHFGGSWDRPPTPPEGWAASPGLEPFRAAAHTIFAEDFTPDAALIAAKDPRVSVLLPFWRSVRPARSLVVVRDPLEVVASLARRDMTAPHAIRLWMRYTVQALRDGDGGPIVFYDDLFERPDVVIDALRPFVDVSDHLDVVASSLRHNRRSELGRADGALGELVGPAHDLYQRLRSEPVDSVLASLDVPPPGSAATEALEDLRRAEARAARLEHDARVGRAAAEEIRALSTQLASARRVDAELSGALAAITDLEGRVAEARHERDAARRDADKQTAARTAAQSHLRSLQQSSAALLRAEAGLRSEKRAAEQRAQRLAGEQQRRVELEKRLDATSGELEQARRAAGEAQHAFDRLRGRRSVRSVLKVAGAVRPAFRVWRAVRRRLSPRSSGVAPEAGPEPRPGPAAEATAAVPKWGEAVDRMLAAPDVAVVVPVYGAPDEVERCLDSVVATTDGDVPLIVIDDASPGDAITALLERYRSLPNITILDNAQNLGFVRTVNRGLEAAGSADVVILNSDTEVTPGWLSRLRAAAYSAADVGTATPFSDNAGAFSAPEPGTNEYPDHPLDSIAREITRTSRWLRPEGPTGNGFCLYMKRSFLDDVGDLDHESFPRGYGEENDICMRGVDRGWRHVIDDATVVRHALGTSFGAERTTLMKQGRAKLDELHPTYTQRVREFLASPDLASARVAVGHAISGIEQDSTPRRSRVLYVMHGAGGGTPLTNLDLMRGVEHQYEPVLLRSDGRRLTFSMLEAGEVVETEHHDLDTPITAGGPRHDEYRNVVAGFIARAGIEMVHVRQFIHHSLDIADICAAMRIPLIVSLHDYYPVCPTTQLLDDQMRFCAGRCTPGQGTCFVDFPWLGDLPHLKHDYVHTWRAMFAPVLEQADALVTTAPSAKQVILNGFPQLAAADFRVIEHGRDLDQRELAVPPTPGGKIRILVPGNVNEQKGGAVIKQLIAMDESSRLEFVVLGNVKHTLKPLGIEMGPYERDEFHGLVERISPSFSAVLSIWAETYSHTVSESWAAGLPVLAFDLGAVGERIARHGGGWRFDPSDPEALYRGILEIADDPGAYEAGRERARVENLRSVSEMSADYLDLYGDVMASRRRVGR